MDLKIDYEKLLELGHTILQNDERLTKILDTIYKNIEELQNYWTGPDAIYFQEEVKEYKTKFYELQKMIQNYGNFLLDISDEKKKLCDACKSSSEKL